MIRPAQPSEMGLLPAIEGRADQLFAAFPEFDDLDVQPCVVPDSGDALKPGSVVLVAEGDHEIVGFIYGYPLDDELFVAQLSVVPENQRQGVGTQLLLGFFSAAGDAGLSGVSLITYSHISFNAPYYASRGFRKIGADAMRPELAQEYASDVALWDRYGPRVAMGLRFAP